MKKILKPGSNCSGLYKACSSGLLVDSADYYRAFYQEAVKARHYLLLAGWQFDSEVRLIRGEEPRDPECDVRLLPFLDYLCERNPSLQIYILAWDFSVIFSLEREWFQEMIFNWASNERIHFRFDSSHAVGATHHQKLVVVDGRVGFIGGMDICSGRWDDRNHLLDNPERKNGDGVAYGAYHDIQSYQTGPVVNEMVQLFVRRWRDSGGEDLELPPAPCQTVEAEFKGALALPAGQVALSLTQARCLQPLRQAVQEIRRLYIDAIMSAEALIYMENQYFSSHAVYWALVSRMTAPGRPPLQIIMILPDHLPFTEELFLGLPQIKMLRSLYKVAEKYGHDFAVFSSVCRKDGQRTMTFIHAKLLMVDDRFLTIGSANATNRSMGLDTELNISWDVATEEDARLVNQLKKIRGSLLAEHAGMPCNDPPPPLTRIVGLIPYLNLVADDPGSRLSRYPLDPVGEERELPDALEPVARLVDPEAPVVEELLYENVPNYETGIFARGIIMLSQLFGAI